jgi:hypothetical protein
MPTWGQIRLELVGLAKADAMDHGQRQERDPTAPSPHDVVRRKYLRALADYTGRPVIVYISGWMEGRPVMDQNTISVNTRDVMGFMEVVHDLPRGPLDLILHSPGGDQNAAGAIMKYLRDEGFGPIRAIVPVCAMSAATMMALCCDEVLMGHHSQLGPIDPQFTLITPEGPRASPAQAILDQFNQAKDECAASPQALAAWLPILRSYAPGLLSQCVTAQTAAEEMVSAAMHAYMFSGLPEPERSERSKKAAEWFNDHKTHRSHGRPLRYDDVMGQEIRVSLLEDDTDELQDRVLSAWHGIQLTLSDRAVLKLIENSNGIAWVLSGQPGFVLTPGPQEQQQQPVPTNRQQRRQAGRRR